MENPAAYFLERYADEQRQASNHRNRRVLSLLICTATIAVVWYIGYASFRLVAVIASGVALGFGGVSLKIRQEKREREDTLLSLLEVDPVIFDMKGRMAVAYAAARSQTFQSIQVSKTHRRMRGSDDKGFTGGAVDTAFALEQERRDSALSDGDYSDLEGELRPSELLVNEADIRYGEMAQKRWASAESADVDLIEAGVERLGDLVRTDWFEKNAKEGAVKEVMGLNDEDETS